MTTYLIRPIQAVDLRQNESDGAILVELNGTIHADVIEADMIAITGEAPSSATLYDVKEAVKNKSDTATNTPATIGITSSTALAANANRIKAEFVNDSDTVIYLKLGSGATLHSGIRLNANGGSYTEENYNGIITAISSGADKNLCVVEVYA